MNLGEKLQRLRKQSGLSQEQLAAQLTVSRQAVSKWELDETMPDTENVVQLSRIFGVSCDYLLRDEVDERGAPVQPAAPGESYLDESGWLALSLAVCAMGLLLAIGIWFYTRQAPGSPIIGLIVQVVGIMLFELVAPRMGGYHKRTSARYAFYMAANWLLMPIPMTALCWWLFSMHIHPVNAMAIWAVLPICDLLCSAVITVVLAVLRRRSMKQ